MNLRCEGEKRKKKRGEITQETSEGGRKTRSSLSPLEALPRFSSFSASVALREAQGVRKQGKSELIVGKTVFTR